MAYHESSFYFNISGNYDKELLKKIIETAFESSEWGPKNYDITDYSNFDMEETPADYDVYWDIAEELKDELIESFPNASFKITAIYSNLMGGGMTEYEVKVDNGKCSVFNCRYGDDTSYVTCPECCSELEPLISFGEIHGIENFRNKTIDGCSEWKCPDCGKTIPFDELVQDLYCEFEEYDI